MWLIFYKPTQLILHPEYQRYYVYKEEAYDAIDRVGLEITDCIVCPVMECESMFMEHLHSAVGGQNVQTNDKA